MPVLEFAAFEAEETVEQAHIFVLRAGKARRGIRIQQGRLQGCVGGLGIAADIDAAAELLGYGGGFRSVIRIGGIGDVLRGDLHLSRRHVDA
jgi:hypothetical protein